MSFMCRRTGQQTCPLAPDQYELAREAFMKLPKPSMRHCCAGTGGTGRIANFIVSWSDPTGIEGAAGG
jgi:hypothetical protein